MQEIPFHHFTHNAIELKLQTLSEERERERDDIAANAIAIASHIIRDDHVKNTWWIQCHVER